MSSLDKAYKIYRDYYKNNQWTGEDVRNYLKSNWIDYEEYNFEEFKEMVLTNDRFNQKWSNGCTRDLSGEERWELLRLKVGDELFNAWKEALMPFGGGLSEELRAYKIPYRIITE